jgi:predicted RNA-binding Zn-ribbon protein involved in translation (DUF1610 family)
MDDLVKEIRKMKFESGYTITKISETLNIGIGKIKYYTSKKYDTILHNKENRAKAEEEFKDLVIKYLPFSNSLNHLCNNLGLRGVDGYYKKIKRIISENNLSTEHFGTLKIKKDDIHRNKFTAISDEEFFVKGHKRHGESIIKRLIDNKQKEYKCEKCGISQWMGSPLRLQVHHINGNHNDNRIENIQLLCPNCHTQTDTYARKNVGVNGGFKVTKRTKEILNGGKNTFVPKDIKELEETVSLIKPEEKKYCLWCGKEITSGKKYCSHECSEKASRKFEVDAIQLLEDIKTLKSYRAVGRKYNVSDNAVRKRCIKLEIINEVEKYITKR